MLKKRVTTMKLQNKTILITGASSGIGREVALNLSHGQNRIIITARRAALLNDLKVEIEKNGSECLAIPADSTDETEVSALMTELLDKYGRLDVALLNAGGGNADSMADMDTQTLKGVISMNIDTVTNYLTPLIQHMKENDSGTIAYTSSPAGFYGLPLSGPYSAAKSAGRVLFQACRIDLAKTNIKFLSIYPGFTYTGTFTEEDRVRAGIPKFMVIQKERAASEIVYALEKGKNNHFFPKRLQFVHSMGRIVPEGLRNRILSTV